MEPLKAYCAVAHPDDCVIFARPYIDSHPDYKWHIVYLTYMTQDPRAREVTAYWNARGITTEFLGFEDQYRDQETQQLNYWSGLDAEASLVTACKSAELVLTHNQDGDYGHIHHKVVNSAFKHFSNKKVYFASTFNYNVRYMATGNLSLDQFPLHRNVIEQMPNVNCGLYIE
jgi:LmbE family N-acetylglucosaminyl deacetylase